MQLGYAVREQRTVKPKPCDYCGAHYHQPYEDGLVECRENLRARLLELEDAIDAIADGSCYDTVHDIRQIARATQHKGEDK